MVSSHVTEKFGNIDGDGEDRCFLSVLLFNYRNNGRFPFQLIILLVSRPHCTRTGRDNLIIGIVFKCIRYSGMCSDKTASLGRLHCIRKKIYIFFFMPQPNMITFSL